MGDELKRPVTGADAVRWRYTDSKGVNHDVKDMPYPFLVSARRKLQRKPTPFGSDASASQRMGEISRDQALIKAMLAEEAARNLTYAANVHLKPDAELNKVQMDIIKEGIEDWTPERKVVYEAAMAELERRRAG